ncbi:MAG: tRNA 4-thiouridine(8) synthase ThiI [Candidatus Micrarchaeota archaeon]|nr:tRNA 4-thiouridine(8) synthase ThiI [Candidatus Micrarchaeota archaeon]
MATNKQILIRFGELWLRGGNRKNYIGMLKRNVAAQLGIRQEKIKVEYDKFLIDVPTQKAYKAASAKLRNMIGISNFSISTSTKASMRDIERAAILAIKEMKKAGAKTIRIDAKRLYKSHKFRSQDIIKKLISAAIKLKMEPDINAYDSLLSVRVHKDKAFVSYGKTDGVHGLPVGSSGRAVVLLSGGIDSPVAAWYAMRRGAYPIYVHMHGFESNAKAKKSKIASILKELSKYYPGYKIYYVPAHIFQLALTKVDNRYEPVLLKALLFRIADMVAQIEDAGAIVTGESLGQVASQTMSNLGASQQTTKLPILRPLIGFDKQEIIRVARMIGTYDLSIKPYRDVCSINAKSTATNASREKIARLLEEMGIDRIAERTLKASSSSKI